MEQRPHGAGKYQQLPNYKRLRLKSDFRIGRLLVNLLFVYQRGQDEIDILLDDYLREQGVVRKLTPKDGACMVSFVRRFSLFESNHQHL